MVLTPDFTLNIYSLHFVRAIISMTSVVCPLALYRSSSVVVAVVAFDDSTLRQAGRWKLYRQVP